MRNKHITSSVMINWFVYGIEACQCMPNFKFYFPLI